MKKRNCKRCGEPITHLHGNALYCKTSAHWRTLRRIKLSQVKAKLDKEFIRHQARVKEIHKKEKEILFELGEISS